MLNNGRRLRIKKVVYNFTHTNNTTTVETVIKLCITPHIQRRKAE